MQWSNPNMQWSSPFWPNAIIDDSDLQPDTNTKRQRPPPLPVCNRSFQRYFSNLVRRWNKLFPMWFLSQHVEAEQGDTYGVYLRIGGRIDSMQRALLDEIRDWLIQPGFMDMFSAAIGDGFFSLGVRPNYDLYVSTQHIATNYHCIAKVDSVCLNQHSTSFRPNTVIPMPCEIGVYC